MNRFIFSSSIIIICLWLSLTGCSAVHRADGFYPVADIPENQIEGKAIVKTNDIECIVLDTIADFNEIVITGILKKDKIKKFADATENRIGKRIGFVYKDSVITAPTVNCRIESGTFQINSKDRNLILEIFSSLKKDMR
ncbi:MAG: hypothetical protein K2H49_01490 [Muribaculaceae bacterium]|nr:hypothetical protein [Muribaculaceae bacterium]